MNLVEAIESGLPLLEHPLAWSEDFHRHTIADVDLGTTVELALDGDFFLEQDFLDEVKSPFFVPPSLQEALPTPVPIDTLPPPPILPMMPTVVAEKTASADSVRTPKPTTTTTTHKRKNKRKNKRKKKHDNNASSSEQDDDPEDKDFVPRGEYAPVASRRPYVSVRRTVSRPLMSRPSDVRVIGGLNIDDMSAHHPPCDECICQLQRCHITPDKFPARTTRLWLEYLSVQDQYTEDQRVCILARNFKVRELWTLRSLVPLHGVDHENPHKHPRDVLTTRDCDNKPQLIRTLIRDPCLPMYLLLASKRVRNLNLDMSKLVQDEEQQLLRRSQTKAKAAAKLRRRNRRGRFATGGGVSAGGGGSSDEADE